MKNEVVWFGFKFLFLKAVKSINRTNVYSYLVIAAQEQLLQHKHNTLTFLRFIIPFTNHNKPQIDKICHSSKFPSFVAHHKCYIFLLNIFTNQHLTHQICYANLYFIHLLCVFHFLNYFSIPFSYFHLFFFSLISLNIMSFPSLPTFHICVSI